MQNARILPNDSPNRSMATFAPALAWSHRRPPAKRSWNSCEYLPRSWSNPAVRATSPSPMWARKFEPRWPVPLRWCDSGCQIFVSDVPLLCAKYLADGSPKVVVILRAVSTAAASNGIRQHDTAFTTVLASWPSLDGPGHEPAAIRLRQPKPPNTLPAEAAHAAAAGSLLGFTNAGRTGTCTVRGPNEEVAVHRLRMDLRRGRGV